MAQTEVRPTKAQKRVLDLLAKDKSPTEIAKAMKINRNGVYAHMRRLRQKGLLPNAARRKPSPARRRPRASSNGVFDAVEKDVKKAVGRIETRKQSIENRQVAIKGTMESLSEENDVLTNEFNRLEEQRSNLMHSIEPADIPF